MTGLRRIEVELKGDEETRLRDELREAQAANGCLASVLQRHVMKVFERCGIETPPEGAQMGLFFRPARVVMVTEIVQSVA